jgi:hypothetical protein
LNWVAETLAGIGAGFDDGGESLSDDARKYYDSALSAFTNLLADQSLDPQTATQIRVRMADVMVRMRDFPPALEMLQTVLSGNANALNVQVEAARLLQKWGGRDPQKYAQAIVGIDTPQAKIWGWGKIATATQSHRQFRDTFFEARFQLARCQFELAKSKSGQEKKKGMADAERTLTQTKLLYPDLGGTESASQFATLLNEILAAQGKPTLKLAPIDITLENTP